MYYQCFPHSCCCNLSLAHSLTHAQKHNQASVKMNVCSFVATPYRLYFLLFTCTVCWLSLSLFRGSKCCVLPCFFVDVIVATDLGKILHFSLYEKDDMLGMRYGCHPDISLPPGDRHFLETTSRSVEARLGQRYFKDNCLRIVS